MAVIYCEHTPGKALLMLFRLGKIRPELKAYKIDGKSGDTILISIAYVYKAPQYF